VVSLNHDHIIILLTIRQQLKLLIGAYLISSYHFLSLDTKPLPEFCGFLSSADIYKSCSTNCVVSDPSVFKPHHLVDMHC